MTDPGRTPPPILLGRGMHVREHALISDLIAADAHRAATTAEDELAADWRRETNRQRHETAPTARRGPARTRPTG